MSTHTLSYKLSTSIAPDMRERLETAGWTFSAKPHTLWQAKGPDGTVSFYQSGSVVLQTKTPDTLVALTGLQNTPQKKKKQRSSTTSTKTSTPASPTQRRAIFERWRTDFGPPDVTQWIGIDEAGKGDFFGPLVTAAVRVQKEDLGWLAECGVGDSKTITDKNVRIIAAQLKKALPWGIVVLMPPKYNELYAQFRNLNRLLAWSHANAAEDVLEKAPAQLILSDQFTKKLLVPEFFKPRAKACRFVQRTRAEADAAVGCASILARAEFLWRMHELEQQFGVRLHKGAGSPTLSDGRRFVGRYGKETLHEVAKTHFKTVQKL